MKNARSLILFLILTFPVVQWALGQSAKATHPNVEGAILWEVSGKDLKAPSYLFGTFHLLTSSFVDSLPIVMEKFKGCSAFAGEMQIDSTVMPKMQAAAFMQGATLDKLLSKDDYDATAKWLKELTGYDLGMFNQMNPMTLSTLLSAYVQQMAFPGMLSKAEPGMDEYFQQLSRQSGKKITGLETVDDQINALFTQFTYERQAELLVAMVRQKDQVAEGMLQMLNSYRHMNLSSLMSLMYDETFTKAEVETLLDNRNKNWMKQLPVMMQESTLFVAVGALHLGGENGLVQLLRNQGYTVKPIN